MVIPTNKTPTADSDESSSPVQGPPKKEQTQTRTTAPNTDDGSRKPFKEVLEATMADKPQKNSKVSFNPDDDDDEKVSLLDLAAGSSVAGTKAKPSITNTAVFRQDVDVDEKGAAALISMESDTDVEVATPAEKVDTKATVRTQDSVETKPEETPEVTTTPTTPQTQKGHTKAEVHHTADVHATVQAKAKIKDDEVVAVNTSTDTKAKVAVSNKAEDKVDASTVVVAPQTPMVHAAVAAVPVPVAQRVSNVREVLLKLAQNMVDQIQLVKDAGKTETTLTIKNVPLFEGVQVKITEFDSAKNQFNLTFSEVNNPTARALIEQQDNQVRLQQALVDKGYTVQMVTVEQKIPGLASTNTQETDARLLGQKYTDGQTGTATDDSQGNVT